VHIAVKNRGGEDEAEVYIVRNNVEKPVITVESISQPTVNPLRPGVGRSTIIASIERISDRESVKILVNDTEIDDFSYNPKSKQLKTVIELARGENEIIIRATNDDGTTEEKRTITF
jgi:ABC-type enterochelin transport system ATPase subunit